MYAFVDPNNLNQEQPDYEILFNGIRADYQLHYYFRYVYYEYLKAKKQNTMMRNFRIDVYFKTGYRYIFTTEDIITLTKNYIGWFLTALERFSIIEHMRNRKLMSQDFTKWIVNWIKSEAVK